MAEVTIKFDDQELWSAVMGSMFVTMPWWVEMEYLDGSDWNTPGSVRMSIVEPRAKDKQVTKVITIEDLTQGMEVAISKGYADPFGYTDWVSLDYDSITGDILMQCAVLGDCIYS